MSRQFRNGDEVVHKSDINHLMTVYGYTADGKVICRWKGKKRFESEEFLESELSKWVPPNDLPAWSNPTPPRY